MTTQQTPITNATINAIVGRMTPEFVGGVYYACHTMTLSPAEAKTARKTPKYVQGGMWVTFTPAQRKNTYHVTYQDETAVLAQWDEFYNNQGCD